MGIGPRAIVVGAGPAGARVAYQLARAGIATTILERMRFPRPKPCGGALSPRVLRLLRRDLSNRRIPIVSTSHRITFRCGDADPLVYSVEGPGVALVERDRFDAFLVDCARDVGAELLEDADVLDVEISQQSVRVHTAARSLRGDIVVGADGAGSTVARSLGLPAARSGVALAARVVGELGDLRDSGIGVDLDAARMGYGWVFPKGQYASVGVGSLDSTLPLRRCLDAYLHRLGLSGRVDPGSVRGHPVPVGIRRVVAGRRFLLVGDAAHLVDPVTGEGIHAALRSADLAADVIRRALARGDGDLLEYAGVLDGDLGAELRMAHRLADPVFSDPARLFRLLAGNPGLLRSVAALAVGNIGYGELWAAVGGMRILGRRGIGPRGGKGED